MHLVGILSSRFVHDARSQEHKTSAVLHLYSDMTVFCTWFEHQPVHSLDMSCLVSSINGKVWEAAEGQNPLTPNDHYSGRTAPLTSKLCILYIYSTNIGTKYFKHVIHSPFFSPLQNAVCVIILTYLVPVLFAFYTQGVLKINKKIIPAAKD